MIASALNLVKSWFDGWAKPQTLQVPGEPKHVYYLVHRDRCERVTAEPAPRQYCLERLADVVHLLKDGQVPASRPTIFLDGDGISVLLDEQDRREMAVMPLVTSDQWLAVRDLAAGRQPRTQRELVQFLRTRMADLVPDDLVKLFRDLKFNVQAENAQQVGHQADAIGKQIRQTVQAAGRDIPEVVTVQLRMYSNVPELPLALIRCAVTVDWQGQSILLQPLPADVEAAGRDAMDGLQQYFRDACPAVPVFQGSPGTAPGNDA